MAAPSAVFTIARVAEMLGEDEDWLSDVALEMDPEAGRLTVYGIDDEGTTCFTRFGIENLKELIEIHKAGPDLMAPLPKHEAGLTWRVSEPGRGLHRRPTNLQTPSQLRCSARCGVGVEAPNELEGRAGAAIRAVFQLARSCPTARYRFGYCWRRSTARAALRAVRSA